MSPEDFKSKNLLVNSYLLLIIITGFICIFFIIRYMFGSPLLFGGQ